MGADLDRGMFEPQQLDAAEIRRRAEVGVAVFLTAYARA